MFDFTENYKIARRVASEGMVLLKNENGNLPFNKNDKIAFIGGNCLDIKKGGSGSADVVSLYVKSLLDGLSEKQSDGKLSISDFSVNLANKKNCYSVEELNKVAEDCNKAIVVIKRSGAEGFDRYIDEKHADEDVSPLEQNGETHISPKVLNWLRHGVGYFVPFNWEIELFENIEKSNIKEVTVILNIGSVVDISYLNNFSKVKSVLLTYLPGMEGGTAIADVLCGDVNPSGKLCDTIAKSYGDYPSAPYYNKSEAVSEYTEDIFVGYRHFETFAKDKVLYPFGFGLSYTKFELSDYKVCFSEGKANAQVTVTNMGDVAGKEVVQLYSSSPNGFLKKPAIELRAYAKTKLLAPNEKETISLYFDIKDMASFDDNGATGYLSAWVLEKGDYKLFLGTSIREIKEISTYKVCETVVTEQLNIQHQAEDKINESITDEAYIDAGIYKNISLYDVAVGKTV